MTVFNPLSRDRGLPEHSEGMLLAITYTALHELASRAQRGPGRDRSTRAPPAPRRLRRDTAHALLPHIIDSALDLAPDATMAAIYGIVSTF